MKLSTEQLTNWLERIAQHDDHRAFRLLFEWFYPQLLRFALFYIKVRETAEEVVQDVFVKIWQIRHTLLAVSNFRAYLFKTARNQCLNQIQKKGLPTLISLEDGSAVDLIDSGETPLHTLEYVEAQSSLQAAIDALPPQCRLIFQLVKEQGLTYREVGEILAISPRTVETQIGIALRKLAAHLQRTSGKL